MMTPETMTEDRFLDVLKATRDMFNWSLLQGGQGMVIRGGLTLPGGHTDLVCPITAVYYEHMGELVEVELATEIGCEALGMDEELADVIVDAADHGNPPNTGIEDRITPMRARLLDALGLPAY